MVKSWKTTVMGVCTILGGIIAAVVQFVQGGFAAIQWEILMAAVTAGVGLIFAKDSNVSNSPSPVAAQKVEAPKP